MALMAERGGSRYRKPLNMLAMLPIITPPFVVGLGLILLFGRAGVVNQVLEQAVRHHALALVLRLVRRLAGADVRLHADRLHDHARRGAGRGAQPGRGGADACAPTGQRTFMTVTLPLLKPGLANAFLVGFIESMADFGNPIVVGGQFSVLSTEIFFAIVGAQFDQGRAASLAWLLTLFALRGVRDPARRAGQAQLHHRQRQGRLGHARCRCRAACSGWCTALALPWIAFTAVVYLFAFAGGFVQTWGRDYTLTLNHFRTAFALEWGQFGLVWAGTAWNSLFTTVKLAAISAPITAAVGPADRVAAGAHASSGARALFEFAALLAFAIPGTVLGVSYILAFNVPPFELTGTGADHRAVLHVPQPAGGRARRHGRLQATGQVARRSLADAARLAACRPCAMWCCRCSSRRWSPRWSTASCAPSPRCRR